MLVDSQDNLDLTRRADGGFLSIEIYSNLRAVEVGATRTESREEPSLDSRSVAGHGQWWCGTCHCINVAGFLVTFVQSLRQDRSPTTY